MPIEKQLVSHTFGIFTEAKRNELVHTSTAGTSFRSASHVSCEQNEFPRDIESAVNLINSVTNDLELVSLEDEASSLLHKVKFQISKADKKPGLNDLHRCWSDLSLFISCKSRKLQSDALDILRKSLCHTPLSKALLSVLIDVTANMIQKFLATDISFVWESKTLLLAEVIFLSCSRLYYHFLVQDLEESEMSRLESLSLLNKALEGRKSLFEDNPLLEHILVIVHRILSFTCPAPRSHSSDDLEDDDDENRSEMTKSDRAPLAGFLWRSLNIWESVSRQKELEHGVISKLLSTKFTEKSDSIQSLDYVLALYTLCECAKLKTEHLEIFLKLRTAMAPKGKTEIAFQRAKREAEQTWGLDLVMTYLTCLADICMFGISTSTQKLALVGNAELYGLADYLTHLPDRSEASSKIQTCAYQLICEVYSFYQCDPMKEGLKNVAWNSIMKFKSSESNKFVLNALRGFQVRAFDVEYSTLSIFSKICTNLSVMAFSGLDQIPKSKDLVGSPPTKSPPRPKTSKCFEKETTLTTARVVAPQRQTKVPKEDESWLEIQKIAEEHLSNEIKQDEIENEKLCENE